MSERENAAEHSEDRNGKTYPYVVSVRFHNSSRSYSFGTENTQLKRGDWVVVETSQGVEMGEVQAEPMSTTYYRASQAALKPVLRVADEEDRNDYEENLHYSMEAFHACEDEIENLGLGMHLLSAEYMLDRSKILFVYQAEQRVDFRELLKKLGARLHCRIELRQIGERDKAKMVGGIGMCGMELCCSRFKTHMDVISINMAKNQLLALNTEKLSGMCGKLMCCLKYENDNYKQLTEGLPKLGAHVEYEGEMYRVTSINVMTNEAHLENPETFQVITIDDLREKAVVKKGIAISRKPSGKGRKQVGTSAPGIHKNNMTSGTLAAGFGTSDESRKHEQSDIPAEQRRAARAERQKESNRRTAKPAAVKAQENAAGAKKRAASASRNVRRPNHVDTKNPNVTVRSFKSHKTMEKEAEGKK